MWGVWIIAIIFMVFTRKTREELTIKQQTEVIEKMKEEELITQEKIDKELEAKRKRERQNQQLGKKPKKLVNIPFYAISPFFAFLFVVIIAPIAEESVFRYLIFDIFGKKNPFAYLFSGLAFIFLHWLGPVLGLGGGLLNATTLKLLFLTYLPMTIAFIYSY